MFKILEPYSDEWWLAKALKEVSRCGRNVGVQRNANERWVVYLERAHRAVIQKLRERNTLRERLPEYLHPFVFDSIYRLEHMRWGILYAWEVYESVEAKGGAISYPDVEARIQLAPGVRLARLCRFLLTLAAYKRYVEPVIADMHEEYYAALDAHEYLHAKWIAVRVWFLVIPGWLVGAGSFLMKAIWSDRRQ
jgi:hypothetical protein